MRNLKLLAIALTVVAALACLPATAQSAPNGTETITLVAVGCTSANPCTATIYRMQIISIMPCPAVGATGADYTAATTSLIGDNVGVSQTQFQYFDTAITLGSIYCYYGTVAYNAGGSASPPSNVVQATIPVPTLVAPTASAAYTPAS